MPPVSPMMIVSSSLSPAIDTATMLMRRAIRTANTLKFILDEETGQRMKSDECNSLSANLLYFRRLVIFTSLFLSLVSLRESESCPAAFSVCIFGILNLPYNCDRMIAAFEPNCKRTRSLTNARPVRWPCETMSISHRFEEVKSSSSPIFLPLLAYRVKLLACTAVVNILLANAHQQANVSLFIVSVNARGLGILEFLQVFLENLSPFPLPFGYLYIHHTFSHFTWKRWKLLGSFR